MSTTRNEIEKGLRMAIEKLPILLLDTSVWLDALLPLQTTRACSVELLTLVVDNDVPVTYAAQSSLDVYRKVGSAYKQWIRRTGRLTEDWAVAVKRWAWDCVTAMQEVATAVPVDASDIWLASKYRDYHDDYEDDLILAACHRAKVDYLVTNDRKLLAHADVCAKTPEQMLGLLKIRLGE